jgi:hypothetical protein
MSPRWSQAGTHSSGLSKADGDRRAEARFATRRGSGPTRTGAHRNSSRRRIVASTANHECDLVTKRFWSRVSKQQVHRLERKRPSNHVVSGLHRKLESLARRARQDIAEAVGAWKRSRGPITCYPRWPGCIAISHAGRVSSGSPTAQIRWVVEPHRWSLAPSTSVIAGDRLRHGS